MSSLGLHTENVFSALVALLIGIAALAQPTQAQTKRAGDTGYLKFGGGLSHYGPLSSDALSFAYAGEVGYQFSPNLGVGLAYQAGRYPILGPRPADDDRFTAQLLARYTFGAKSWTVAPYVDAGGQASFGGVDIGGGPTAGVGVDVVLTDYASFYVESRTNLVFPETAMDGFDSGNAFDELTHVGAGFKLNLQTATTPPRVIALDGPTQVQTGESVTYTATINGGEATRPLTYRWSFGDGATASGLTAPHAFAQPGTYTVTFTASNRAGEASRSLTVTAERPPQPASITSLQATPNPAEEGQTVSFSSTVEGDQPITRSWSFGDGATGSGSSPSHTYEEPGEYTVRLEASNEAGQDSRTLTVRVNRALPNICTTISEYNSAFFESNSSTLTDEARTALTENADVLSKCPNLQVQIQGFAAPNESDPMDLSEARAEAVMEFYRNNGVPQDRMTTSGEGAVEGVTTKKGDTRQYRRADTVPMQTGSSRNSMNEENGSSSTARVPTQRSSVSGPASRPSGPSVQSPATDSQNESSAGRWTVIVASMSQEDGAETMAQRYRRQLTSENLSVRIVTEELSQGVRHRVAVGGFESYDAAKQAIQEHGAQLPSSAWPLQLR